MAVPARKAKVIFEAILKSFAGIEYDWIPNNINPIIHQNHKKLFASFKNTSEAEVGVLNGNLCTRQKSRTVTTALLHCD
jgi:hypothetical protein